MSKTYRVLVQTIENGGVTSESIVIEDPLSAPTNCLDFSLELKKQIHILQRIQDHILDERLVILSEKNKSCPCCKHTLIRSGKQKSLYHDVLTDHKVTFIRLKCTSCGYEAPCTVRSLLGNIQSGELQRIQAELGGKHSFREAETIFDTFSGKPRAINNHDRIKKVAESVGSSLSDIAKEERELIKAEEAEQLILNVDGGHVKTIEEGRSIEAMTSVVYRPENVVYNKKETRRHLASKNCAASVKDDNQQEIISSTIIAALKQGLTKNTEIIALCDGARNCWSVVDALEPLSKSLTRILDWFHISMKMENISLPKSLKSKFMRVKWHLWRGRADRALTRLEQLKKSVKNSTSLQRISQFITYIFNNQDKIVNYAQRKNKV